MASAVHYVHPDKPPELWINEVAVAPTHRSVHGRRLMEALFERGHGLGCGRRGWPPNRRNLPARRLMRQRAGTRPEPFVMIEFSPDVGRLGRPSTDSLRAGCPASKLARSVPASFCSHE